MNHSFSAPSSHPDLALESRPTRFTYCRPRAVFSYLHVPAGYDLSARAKLVKQAVLVSHSCKQTERGWCNTARLSVYESGGRQATSIDLYLGKRYAGELFVGRQALSNRPSTTYLGQWPASWLVCPQRRCCVDLTEGERLAELLRGQGSPLSIFLSPFLSLSVCVCVRVSLSLSLSRLENKPLFVSGVIARERLVKACVCVCVCVFTLFWCRRVQNSRRSEIWCECKVGQIVVLSRLFTRRMCLCVCVCVCVCEWWLDTRKDNDNHSNTYNTTQQNNNTTQHNITARHNNSRPAQQLQYFSNNNRTTMFD